MYFIQILLIIEEFYDNILVLTKLEKMLNNVLNNQIYLHYTIFARVQSFASSLQLVENKQKVQNDEDSLEYVILS